MIDHGPSSPMSLKDRIFMCHMPTCVSYSDRTRERHGDYVVLARLFYDTLELQIQPDCPADLRQFIVDDAAAIQAKRGTQLQIAGNMSVLLGSHGKCSECGQTMAVRPVMLCVVCRTSFNNESNKEKP